MSNLQNQDTQKNRYVEISNNQAITLFGRDLGLKYLLQDNFKIYQNRSGHYFFKLERRKYTTTTKINMREFYEQTGIVQAVRDYFKED